MVAGFFMPRIEVNQVITATEPQTPLLDHVDMRMVVANGDDIRDRHAIVKLDPDHPGFRDKEYRARRNAIAQIATTYIPGSPIPAAPYTAEEHDVWRTIWKALGPAHREHACAEYLECLERLTFDPDRIPQLDEVSQKVEAISGFRLEPVAGLVEPRIFLESLARGVFFPRSTSVTTRRRCTRRNPTSLTRSSATP